MGKKLKTSWSTRQRGLYHWPDYSCTLCVVKSSLNNIFVLFTHQVQCPHNVGHYGFPINTNKNIFKKIAVQYRCMIKWFQRIIILEYYLRFFLSIWRRWHIRDHPMMYYSSFWETTYLFSHILNYVMGCRPATKICLN